MKPFSNPLPHEVFVIGLMEVLGVIPDRGLTQTNRLQETFSDGLIEVRLSVSLIELVEYGVKVLPSSTKVVGFGHT